MKFRRDPKYEYMSISKCYDLSYQAVVNVNFNDSKQCEEQTKFFGCEASLCFLYLLYPVKHYQRVLTYELNLVVQVTGGVQASEGED